MSLSRVKGKQIETESVILTPGESPLELNGYTVSATGSVKQLVNLEYLDTLPIGITNSLQEVTDVGNTSSNDLEITDPTKGFILRSPNGDQMRLTINNSGQILSSW